jgi:hypothetical protein
MTEDEQEPLVDQFEEFVHQTFGLASQFLVESVELLEHCSEKRKAGMEICDPRDIALAQAKSTFAIAAILLAMFHNGVDVNHPGLEKLADMTDAEEEAPVAVGLEALRDNPFFRAMRSVSNRNGWQ